MWQLVIGNKNYSSWSMRPWVLLRHFGIAFESAEIVELNDVGDMIALTARKVAVAA